MCVCGGGGGGVVHPISTPGILNQSWDSLHGDTKPRRNYIRPRKIMICTRVRILRLYAVAVRFAMMKRQRSASTKESPKEAPVSLNKRHKSASLDECPITLTTRKQLASLPTHGELVVDQGVAQIPSLASKSVSDIRQALASVRKQKKSGGSADVSTRLHLCASITRGGSACM